MIARQTVSEDGRAGEVGRWWGRWEIAVMLGIKWILIDSSGTRNSLIAVKQLKLSVIKVMKVSQLNHTTQTTWWVNWKVAVCVQTGGQSLSPADWTLRLRLFITWTESSAPRHNKPGYTVYNSAHASLLTFDQDHCRMWHLSNTHF